MSLRRRLHFFPRRRGEVRAHHESGLSLATSHKPLHVRFSRDTRHETRITAFMLFTNHGLCGRSVRRGCARGGCRQNPPGTAVRTTSPAGKSLFSSSPLFTIVHYCSPLFGKKYCPAPQSSRRPVTASLGTFARHGASRAAVRAPSALATLPVGFSRVTRHESRNMVFPVPPATPRRATPSPTNGLFTKHESRITRHGFYRRPDGRSRRPVTACLPRIARHCSELLG